MTIDKIISAIPLIVASFMAGCLISILVSDTTIDGKDWTCTKSEFHGTMPDRAEICIQYTKKESRDAN